jgi:hypothetical protein
MAHPQEQIDKARRSGEVHDETTFRVFHKPTAPPMREVTKGGWAWREKPLPASKNEEAAE